jgi:hypothetical protein|tara:strand:- start:1772 stop:2539 length:768 start_codon:yes stop_codon:yes gene_type:complete
MNKVVAKKNNGSAAVAIMKSFENVSTGFEDMGADDLQLPRLKLLQAMSPEIENDEALRAGQILNSVTGDSWSSDGGVKVIPCVYHKTYVEWAPQGSGTKGPVAVHQSKSVMDDTVRGEDNKFYKNDNSGNYIEETANYFVLIVGEKGETSQAVISMKSSQLTPSRNWNSKMKNLKIKNSSGVYFTPPMWSHIYTLRSEKAKNGDKTWYKWKIDVDSMLTSDSHVQEASSFSEEMGKAKDKLVPEQDETKSGEVPF